MLVVPASSGRALQGDQQDYPEVDDRMNKISTTLDKLGRQLQKFQEELETRQKDPLVINVDDYLLTDEILESSYALGDDGGALGYLDESASDLIDL